MLPGVFSLAFFGRFAQNFSSPAAGSGILVICPQNYPKITKNRGKFWEGGKILRF
jgi:hypothetical protein